MHYKGAMLQADYKDTIDILYCVSTKSIVYVHIVSYFIKIALLGHTVYCPDCPLMTIEIVVLSQNHGKNFEVPLSTMMFISSRI